MNKSTVILRGKSIESDLLSSFGSSLKETRLTAFLGYLIFLKHSNLLKIFKIEPPIIKSVKIEFTIESQRCDIIVEGLTTDYIIEAKLFYENPIPQLLNQRREYSKTTSKRIKLIGITNGKITSQKGILILSWKNISDSLDNNINKLKILSEELKMHLINKGLVQNNIPDIYTRELGNEISVTMFFKVHIYLCHYPKKSNIEKCNYFVPHISATGSMVFPGINHGISYVAKINGTELVESKKDLKMIIVSHMKENKLNKTFSNVEQLVKRLDFNPSKKHIILLLSKPYLVFNPPIKKNKLQEGSGWLSKNYFTFEELFEAALS